MELCIIKKLTKKVKILIPLRYVDWGDPLRTNSAKKESGSRMYFVPIFYAVLLPSSKYSFKIVVL